MSSLNFRVSDRDAFLAGLLSNVVTMQWWITKPLLIQHIPDIDLDDTEVQRWAAERVVDVVAERFGNSAAAADMQGMRAELVGMLVDGMRTPEAPTPKPPKLKLV